MSALQIVRFCYLGRVQLFFPHLCLVFWLTTSLLPASGPRLQNPVEPTTEEPIPTTQEDTEGAILPDEPELIEPLPESAFPPSDSDAVQPLPTREDFIQGSSASDLKKKVEDFRVLRTEAEGQQVFIDLKTLAFAAPTEREKRALLRIYYERMGEYLISKSASLKNESADWTNLQLSRLQRPRTEGESVTGLVSDANLAALEQEKRSLLQSRDDQ